MEAHPSVGISLERLQQGVGLWATDMGQGRD